MTNEAATRLTELRAAEQAWQDAPCGRTDMRLTAALWNNRRKLLADAEAVEAVRALHPTHVEKSGARVCATCLLEAPCPTVRALPVTPDTEEAKS